MKANLATFPRATRILLLAAAALTCGFSSVLGADNYAVRWQGKYINDESPSAILRLGAPDAVPNGIVWRYHETDPKSPIAHYNEDASSAIFYGALEIVSPDPIAGKPNLRVISLSPQEDRIALAAGAGSSTAPVNIRGMLFWKKENFLNGLANNNPLDITSFSELSATLQFVRGDTEARFVIQSGEKWYLSEEAFRLAKGERRAEEGAYTLGNLSSAQWAEWSPGNQNGEIGPVPTEFNIPGSSLTDIQGTGIYFSSIFDKPTNRAEFSLLSFQALTPTK